VEGSCNYDDVSVRRKRENLSEEEGDCILSEGRCTQHGWQRPAPRTSPASARRPKRAVWQPPGVKQGDSHSRGLFQQPLMLAMMNGVQRRAAQLRETLLGTWLFRCSASGRATRLPLIAGDGVGSKLEGKLFSRPSHKKAYEARGLLPGSHVISFKR